MLHCSHCLIRCEADRFDDFVCCSSCGKVLGQFLGGKYIDHSRPIIENATKLKKRKNEKNQKREEKMKSIPQICDSQHDFFHGNFD